MHAGGPADTELFSLSSERADPLVKANCLLKPPSLAILWLGLVGDGRSKPNVCLFAFAIAI
jgi:hypothetical protein